MAIQVYIKKNRWGDFFACTEFDTLFQFSRRTNPAEWYYWIRRNFDPDKTKRLSVKFLVQAIRAKYFILNGKGLDDAVEFVSGVELLPKYAQNEINLKK